MSSRQRGVLHFIAGFVGITVFYFEVIAAQVTGSSSSSRPGALRTDDISSSPTRTISSYDSNASSEDETAAYIARGYASTMNENEQRLTIIRDSLLTESVCDGEPMVILKSSTVPANGACLAAQSRYNLSCSCLSGFTNTTVWDFCIRAPDAEPTSPFPTTISDGNVVRVDSLMMLEVPPDLLTFKIHGDSSNLVPVNLEKATADDDNLAIVRSQGVSSLTNVDLFNLDLAEVPIASGFVPTTLTSLSMRRCNLSSLGQPFLESFTALESLNLAANRISSIYSNLPGSIEAINAMTEINLANNSFTEFPAHLLQFPNLQKLDLSGNSITNLTVTSDDLAVISQLSVFQIDIHANGSDCDNGEWQEVHNTKLCVVNSVSASTPEVVAGSAKDNATNWTIFVLVAAFGGCFVGFLLFFLATRFVQYQQERQHEADSSSPVAEDVQTSRAGDSTAIQAFYNSLHPTMNAELVKDPVIASFRLKYKDLHVGRCISKGGFGLVYMEVLLGRDYDERADIFSFGIVLSEIDTDDYPYWNSGSAPAQDNPDERRSQEQKILEKVALGSLRPTFYNDCPPGVLALASSCLEGRPENRPSASEVVLTIKELMREMQFDSKPRLEPEPDEIVTDGFLSSA
ncbi:hypothetical protein PC129_g3041 [Phytophthora cactorum]|uniref:non-specific serine/threonine protein kinase n=1 Tax=Phytophthora cactorum TaxID=29920 RepID=A0A8T1IMP3_9STRA|nr:hypothetical protein C6341_g1160 [Phytophthora cactorum]KAG3226364.1 hypothetical protein PC129_g3041 [Phytophthora cactorum]